MDLHLGKAKFRSALRGSSIQPVYETRCVDAPVSAKPWVQCQTLGLSLSAWQTWPISSYGPYLRLRSMDSKSSVSSSRHS